MEENVYYKVLDNWFLTRRINLAENDIDVIIANIRSLLDELKRMEARYGKKQARRIMRQMLHHYRRLAFIDMGYQDQEPYRQFSRKTAKAFNLTYAEIRGTPEVIRRICNGPWDDAFVVVPPGHTVRLEDFGMV